MANAFFYHYYIDVIISPDIWQRYRSPKLAIRLWLNGTSGHQRTGLTSRWSSMCSLAACGDANLDHGYAAVEVEPLVLNEIPVMDRCKVLAALAARLQLDSARLRRKIPGGGNSIE